MLKEYPRKCEDVSIEDCQLKPCEDCPAYKQTEARIKEAMSERKDS